MKRRVVVRLVAPKRTQTTRDPGVRDHNPPANNKESRPVGLLIELAKKRSTSPKNSLFEHNSKSRSVSGRRKNA